MSDACKAKKWSIARSDIQQTVPEIWSLQDHTGRCPLFSAQDHPLSTEALPQFTCKVSLPLLDYQRTPTSLTPDQVWILPITSEELYLEEVGRSWPWSQTGLNFI